MWNGWIGIWIYKTNITTYGIKALDLLNYSFSFWLKLVVVVVRPFGRPVFYWASSYAKFNKSCCFLTYANPKYAAKYVLAKSNDPISLCIHYSAKSRKRVHIFGNVYACAYSFFSSLSCVKLSSNKKHTFIEWRKKKRVLIWMLFFFLHSFRSFVGRLKVKSNHWKRSIESSIRKIWKVKRCVPKEAMQWIK